MKWVVLVLMVIVFAPPAAAVDDLQFWNAAGTRLLQRGRFTLDFQSFLKFRENGREPLEINGGIRGGYRLDKHWHLGLTYRRLDFRGVAERFTLINRYEANITYSQKTGPITWSNRARYEYNRLSGRPDFRRIRLRVQGSHGEAHGRPNRWFFSFEQHYRLNSSKFRQFRFVPIGMEFKLSAERRFSVYYMLQHIRPRATENHILGTSFKF